MVRDCNTPPCSNTTGPDFAPDGVTPPSNGGQCIPSVSGEFCPPLTIDQTCRPWQLSTSRDTCYIDSLTNEAIAIGGAPINVYRLLGVHEQAKLIDATGMGKAISNGDLPGFPATNAFTLFKNEWRSIQKGPAVIPSAFIGYDFGEIRRLDGSLRMYGIEANVRKHIMAFAIMQSSSQKNRATKVRLERSEDGKKWFGVSILPLPDDDCLNTILTKHSVASRYWRLRPVEFNGDTKDHWGVQAFQMFHNFQATHINNIQDKVFLENRNRAYSKEPVAMKAFYDLIDVQSELSKFGIELPSQTMSLRINFSQTVASLGRPFVIGDIIEIPPEAQFSAQMKKILKWMEVTDVGWSSEGYTPGWQTTLLVVTVQPAMVTEETQDLFGDLKDNAVENGLGLVDRNDGNDDLFQDYFDASQASTAEAKDNVPEKGAEGSSTVRAWEQYELDNAAAQGVKNLQKIGLNSTGLYVEDAMPPNNEPFKELQINPNTITTNGGLPATATNGEYLRVTYTGFSDNPPAKLYRYSSSKQRWIFLESDKRAMFNPDKPVLQQFLSSPNRKPETNITK